MFNRLASALWGKFESTDELKKFLKLAVIFGLIIGVYWTLRPIKDSIFMSVVGREYLWMAKIVSLAVVFPLVILYSKLLDMFHRHNVFYVLMGGYAVLALIFTFIFMHPEMGLANTVAAPTRYAGWAWYVFVESFGSLIVALFWGITTDITAPQAAQRGFPIIALFGQMGNIFGPYILRTDFLGLAHSGPIVGICGVLMVLTALGMWYFQHSTPEYLMHGFEDKAHKSDTEPEPGFFEGFWLLVSQSYLLGIFIIITFYEIIVTIIDYHFKQTAGATFATEGEVSAFLSSYAYTTGIVATLCVLLGINNIQRRLGMKASLIVLPILIGIAILVIKFNPSALNIAFWIMVFSKAVNYALNAPTLKQLYIPTSSDTKYKAQAWLEMFGSRGAKGGASVINSFRGKLGLTGFLTMSVALSFGLIGIWILVALYVSRTFNTAIEKNEVVC